MTLEEIIKFDEAFKQNFKITPTYTGSTSLWLDGVIDRLPKDIDIVLDEISYGLLLEHETALEYEGEEHVTLVLDNIKVDVFPDKNYPTKNISRNGEIFCITRSKVSIEKKKKYISKYISMLNEGTFLTPSAMISLTKHINDINKYNSEIFPF